MQKVKDSSSDTDRKFFRGMAIENDEQMEDEIRFFLITPNLGMMHPNYYLHLVICQHP